MPYVVPEARPALDDATRAVRDLVAERGVTEGELNYILTTIVLAWTPSAPRYADLLDARGTFTMAGEEFARRVVAGYEDAACATNGDVFPNPVNGPSGAP